MSVLVTGATGFIGARLVRALGDEAVAGTRQGRPLGRLAGWRGPFVQIDPVDQSTMIRVLLDLQPRAVIHTAVVRDAHGHAIAGPEVAMIDATCAAAQHAGTPTVVTFGSAAEYGLARPPMSESTPLQPATPHGRAKAAGTFAAARWASQQDGPRVVTLRPFHVTGHGEPASKFLPRVLDAAHGGPPVPLVAGDPVRDIVDVDDVVRAVLAALVKPPPDGIPVNLCSGRAVTPMAIIDQVGHAMGRPVPTAGEHPRTSYDDEQRIGDPTRAEELWGWRSSPLHALVPRWLADWPWEAS